MSSITIASLPRISRETLAARLQSVKQPLSSSPIAVVDVRGSDYIGGHIRGCTNIPSNQLDFRMPELARTLKDKQLVVFHCALSQQRGPAAALQYLRERARSWSWTVKDGQESLERGEKAGDSESTATTHEQEVCILEGGFTQWQEKYGADETLTEGWQKDIWEFGY